MHIIPPFEAGVTLYRLDRTSHFYANRRLLLNDLGISGLRHAVGPRLDPQFGWRYVILDENNSPLFAKDFEHFWKSNTRSFSHRYGFSTWNGVGPVPGTGRHRRGHYFRHIHTTAERRANVVMEEGEPRPRGRRSGTNLPNSWDDFSRSDYDARNWKHYRKHQRKGD
jgi:hypothetical protein